MNAVHQTRVKICGISTAGQAKWVVDAGADAIGLVFYPSSPRHLSVTAAKQITQSIPAFVSVVALFRNASVGAVQQVCREVQPDVLQFHGNETAEFCEQFQRPWIKALGMSDHDVADEVLRAAEKFPNARGLLLDSHGDSTAGGSGKAFDWRLIPAELRGRFILAGGLNPANVGAAVRDAQPWAVDVSSGVESLPGIKSQQKIQAFMAAVRTADRVAP